MSNILAFKLSAPVSTDSDAIEWAYDATKQTGVWVGGTTPLAVRCTRSYTGGKSGCNAYGSYCTTSGGTMLNFGYFCD